MLDFFKPPTDNLYKFQALAGLLLALVSLTYPVWLYHQSLLRYLDAKNDETQLQIQAEYVQKRLDLLESQLNTLLDQPDQIKKRVDELERQPKSGENSTEIERQRKRWQDAIDSRTKLLEASQELSSGLRAKIDLLAHQKSISETELALSRKTIYAGIVGFVFGVLITLLGFRNWSKRVQVYQDAILKKEAEGNPPAAA